MKALYLLLNLAVISIPLAFSWKGRFRFVDRWRAFFPACLLVLAAFVIWDIPFAAAGVWGFDKRYLLGPSLFGLPMEEWLFFVCIPYACVFTYHALEELRFRPVGDSVVPGLNLGVAILCVLLLIACWGQLYTTVTALLTGVFAAWLWFRRPAWAAGFWTAYLVLLLPFVLTNGVLTGVRFWEYPLLNVNPDAITNHVVWYNNAENLGIRFLSIPLDDFLYAFLLIGTNIGLMELFGSRSGGWTRRLAA